MVEIARLSRPSSILLVNKIIMMINWPAVSQIQWISITIRMGSNSFIFIFQSKCKLLIDKIGYFEWSSGRVIHLNYKSSLFSLFRHLSISTLHSAPPHRMRLLDHSK